MDMMATQRAQYLDDAILGLGVLVDFLDCEDKERIYHIVRVVLLVHVRPQLSQQCQYQPNDYSDRDISLCQTYFEDAVVASAGLRLGKDMIGSH